MASTKKLTVADVVVLSLLCERPMHGYELWAELLRRHVWKWAEISRPQVYYTLNKLADAGSVTDAGDADAALGPERRVLKPTAAGRRALAQALAREDWSLQRPPSPFLTWMVLSWQSRPADFIEQLQRRTIFLQSQLDEDTHALEAVIEETSPSSDAAMVVRLSLRLMATELEWLGEVAKRQRPG